MANGKHKRRQEQAMPESRGPGRPPGSPNVDYTVVQTITVACRRCGSTEFRDRRKFGRETKYSGLLNGQEYNRTMRYACKCAACGTPHLVIERQFVPPAVEEAGYDEPPADEAGDVLADEECV